MCRDVFPYETKARGKLPGHHIMLNEKNHSILHCGETIGNWGDSIIMSAEAPGDRSQEVDQGTGGTDESERFLPSDHDDA